MEHSEALQRARTIVSIGRMIHMRVMKAHFSCLVHGGRGESSADLTLAQMKAVMATWEKGSATIKDLAEDLDVSPPSASAMVDRLVELGVLTREQDPNDRRKVVVRVAPSAMETIQRVEERIVESFLGLVQRIGSENARKWCEILELVREAMDEEAHDARAASMGRKGE